MRWLRLLPVAILTLVTGCGVDRAATVEVIDDVPYTASATLAVYRPVATAAAPVAVLLHGCCGDRADLGQLALALAGEGMVVYNASWTTADAGGGWPVSYREAACAVAFAASSAPDHGGDGSHVVLVGWSDGALLASVVALGGVDPGPECAATELPAPAVMVGLGGFYGYEAGDDPATEAGRRFLGAGDEGVPGDPHSLLAAAVWRVPSSLVTGTRDELHEATQAWARALGAHGLPVEILETDGTHFDVISPRTPAGALAVRSIVAAGAGDDDE
jgi:acetyl esterase/lipase